MEMSVFMNDFDLRIALCEIKKKDWMEIHKYASQEKSCLYQAWGPNSVENTIVFVNQILKDAVKEPRARFVYATTLKNSGKMIGSCEINIRDTTNKIGEISYIINPEYWGKGYATESATQLLNFGFQILKLHRIYATCDPRNIGSSRVLQKIGMVQEGKMRENLLLRDGWRDSLLYGILFQDWQRMN